MLYKKFKQKEGKPVDYHSSYVEDPALKRKETPYDLLSKATNGRYTKTKDMRNPIDLCLDFNQLDLIFKFIQEKHVDVSELNKYIFAIGVREERLDILIKASKYGLIYDPNQFSTQVKDWINSISEGEEVAKILKVILPNKFKPTKTFLHNLLDRISEKPHFCGSFAHFELFGILSKFTNFEIMDDGCAKKHMIALNR